MVFDITRSAPELLLSQPLVTEPCFSMHEAA